MQSGADSKTKFPRSLAAGFALLILVSVAAYWPALHGAFIWDDDDYVTKNPTLTSVDGLRRIWLEPGAVPQYYPMVHTTFWVERHLWGLDPFGYHIVNLCLHLFTAFLLALLLSRLAIPGAFFAAALFALHPVHVESVAWVTERKNVLSAVFYFGAFLAWLRFRPLQADAARATEKGKLDRTDRSLQDSRARRPSAVPSDGQSHFWSWYILSLVLFLCAIFSKTVTGSLPVAILILIWWKRGRVGRADLALLLPFVLLAAGMGAITIWMERLHVGATGAEFELSFLDRLVIAGKALWFYLTKLAVPVDLSFIYTRWRIDSGDLVQLAPAVAVLTLALALFLARRRIGQGPLAAALFFSVTLFPALGFVNIYPMRFSFVADHFQYLASVGPIVLFASGTALLSRRIPARRAKLIAITLATVLLTMLTVLTHQRATVFENQEALWLDTLEKNEQAWLARNNLGKYYEDQGRFDLAESEYRKAVAIRPDLDLPLYNLGNLAVRRGDVAGAIAYYEEALRLNPGMADAHLQLGNVYRGLDLAKAFEHYRMAVELDSTFVAARRSLAFTLAELGEIEGSIEQLQIVLQQDGADLSAMTRLAWLLATALDPNVRDGAEAARWAEAACRGSGYGDPEHLASLAAALAELGRFDDAVRTAGRAAELAESAGQQQAAATLRSQAELYKSHRTISSVMQPPPVGDED